MVGGKRLYRHRERDGPRCLPTGVHLVQVLAPRPEQGRRSAAEFESTFECAAAPPKGGSGQVDCFRVGLMAFVWRVVFVLVI